MIFKSKFEQLIRIVFINTLTQVNKSILLVEYPKSGGTWLGQLISGYFDIPFPRNKFPGFNRSVYHGHYLPKNNILNNKKIVLLVRDGRDVMVSLYHHQLLWNNKNRLHPKDVLYHRKNVPFDDFENVKDNMEAFIKYTFTNRPSKLQHYTYMGDWVEFNQAWLDKIKKGNNNIYIIKYEDLLKDTYKAMHTMLKDFFKIEDVDEATLKEIVHKFSFENQTKRKQGVEQKESFLRKGIAGDWKNYFTKEAEEEFMKHAQTTLFDLEYK